MKLKSKSRKDDQLGDDDYFNEKTENARNKSVEKNNPS